MKVDLTGKIAIVTGGADGIGKACTKMLLENGAAVTIADVSAKGPAAAAELGGIGPCQFVKTDVTDEKQVDRLIQTVVERHGRLDIMVNNAGFNAPAEKRANIDGMPTDIWRSILDVDLNGVFYCSRAAAKAMVAQKSGRIVNIGSVLGSVPARQQTAYVAAKAAVHRLTEAMAVELAPFGITVNAVAPGSTLTEGTRSLFYGDDPQLREKAQRMLSHVPMGRPGEPEEMASAILFLVGDGSTYITGHVLTVDGGWTCGFSRDF
ncbi:MAG: SDR family oxidoreductase [Phycisphaerae bacterium]|nr:SDR family oxidoreductase [Phycisphaerae bacterium]